MKKIYLHHIYLGWRRASCHTTLEHQQSQPIGCGGCIGCTDFQVAHQFISQFKKKGPLWKRSPGCTYCIDILGCNHHNCHQVSDFADEVVCTVPSGNNIFKPCLLIHEYCYRPCFGNGGLSLWECSHAGCYVSGKEHGIPKVAWESRQTQTDHPGKLGLLSADPLGHDFLGRAHAHCR